MRTIPQYVKDVDERVPLDQLGAQGILFEDRQELKSELDEARGFVQLARLWGEKPSFITARLGSTPIERFLTGLRFAAPDTRTSQFTRILAESWAASLKHNEADLKVGDGVPDLKSIGATPRTFGYNYIPNADPNDPNRFLLLIIVTRAMIFPV